MAAADPNRTATPSPATTNCSCRSSPPRWPPAGLKKYPQGSDELLRRQSAESPGKESSPATFVRPAGGIGICGNIRSATRRRPSFLLARHSRGLLSTAQSAGRLAHLLVLAAPSGLCYFCRGQSNRSRYCCHRLLFSGPAPLSKAAQAPAGVRSKTYHRHQRSLVRPDLFVSLCHARRPSRLTILALSRLEETQIGSRRRPGPSVDVFPF